ncbi:MAG: sensor histidine kinase, partial [Bacillota bacterium]
LSGNARQRKTIEIERQETQGNSVFRVGVRPLRRDNGSTVLITIEDITQQCVAKSSRNDFIAQATHELRTPLSNIRLYVETALTEGEKDPLMRAKCLNVINDESRRLERMVGEMLSVAEIEAGSLKIHNDDVRLDKLFEELEADYAAQAKDKNITLQFNLPPKLPVIHADRDRLILAIHNLIGNALKYTPNGGQVTVGVRAEANQLLVDVSDTGIGIDEQEQQLVFDKFYRSKDPRVGKITGSGLGLALAREVVRLHGGDITLKSELNKGSTFTVAIPTLKEAA